MIVASHVRKARYDRAACPICRAPITTGQTMCRVGRGGTWMHTLCFIRRYHPPTEGT